MNKSAILVCIGRRKMEYDTEKFLDKDLAITMVAGFLGGCVAKTLVAPLDLARIAYQSSPSSQAGLKSYEAWAKTTYQCRGLRGFWRGHTAALSRIGPFSGFQNISIKYYMKVMKTHEMKANSAWMFFAGASTGTFAMALTHPLDTIRSVMAVTDKEGRPSMVKTAQRGYTAEGMKFFYRGFTPALIGIAPYSGIRFGTYGFGHKWAVEHGNENSLKVKLAWGILGGILGVTATYPYEVVRVRMQTTAVLQTTYPYKGTHRAFMHIYRNEGWSHGLYKGFSIHLVRTPIISAFTFVAIDELEKFLYGFHPKREEEEEQAKRYLSLFLGTMHAY